MTEMLTFRHKSKNKMQCIFSIISFLNICFEIVTFEKQSTYDKNLEKLPSMQRVINARSQKGVGTILT